MALGKKLRRKIDRSNRWFDIKHAFWSWVCRRIGHSKKVILRMKGDYCKRCGNKLVERNVYTKLPVQLKKP